MSDAVVSGTIVVEVEGGKYVRRVEAKDVSILDVRMQKALKELTQTLIVKHNK